jgi:hypothetical protein
MNIEFNREDSMFMRMINIQFITSLINQVSNIYKLSFQKCIFFQEQSDWQKISLSGIF